MEYQTLADKIKKLNAQIKPLEMRQKEIKRYFEKEMVGDGLVQRFIRNTNEVWYKLYYRKGIRKVNFELLSQFLNKEQFESVVSQSTYFVIGKASKKDVSKL